MSGTKIVLCVAAGVVLGGLCLCGFGSWMVTRPHPDASPGDAAAGRYKDDEIERQRAESALSDIETRAIRSGSQTVDVYLSAIQGPRSAVLPPGASEVFATVEDQNAPNVVVELVGYNNRLTLTKASRTFGGEVPNGWSGNVSLRLVGARAAHLVFVSGLPDGSR